MQPATEMWKQFLEQSTIPEYNKLAETFHITKDWDEFYNYYIDQYLIRNGTHAVLQSQSATNGHLIYYWGWYTRSKERLRGQNPYGGYLSNKKWHLNEVDFDMIFV